MRILLTGHKGYLGQHLHNVIRASRHVSDDVKILDEGEKFHKWIEKFMSIISPPHPETIIHCGAIADSTYTDPDIFQWNYEATHRIADYAASKNIHLVFISSSCAIRPHMPYDWSKLCAENYIKAIVKNYTILRIFNIYGDEDNREAPSVPYQLAKRTLQKMYTPFTRDYIHVADVVQAILQVTHKKVYGLYEVGTGIGTQVYELADAVGWRPKIVTEAPSWMPRYKAANASMMLPGFKCHRDLFKEIRKLKTMLSFRSFPEDDEHVKTTAESDIGCPCEIVAELGHPAYENLSPAEKTEATQQYGKSL